VSIGEDDLPRRIRAIQEIVSQLVGLHTRSLRQFRGEDRGHFLPPCYRMLSRVSRTPQRCRSSKETDAAWAARPIPQTMAGKITHQNLGLTIPLSSAMPAMTKTNIARCTSTSSVDALVVEHAGPIDRA
jgi:hypothetical protein